MEGYLAKGFLYTLFDVCIIQVVENTISGHYNQVVVLNLVLKVISCIGEVCSSSTLIREVEGELLLLSPE